MQTNRYSTTQNRTQVFDAGLRNHMVSVYNRMTMGVLITAIVAWLVSSSDMLMGLFMGGPQSIVVMLAPLAIVWFGFNPASMSSQKLRISFIALSVVYGISFSVIALVVAKADIARAFFITSAMFAALSIFGYTTKKDLSGMRQFLFMSVIGLVLIGFFSIFFPLPGPMQTVVHVATVFIFAGVTAYETQNVKRMYHAGNGAEINSRLAWSAALSLYISFVAMFQSILALMSER